MSRKCSRTVSYTHLDVYKRQEEAMAYYELADSKDGYGEAFAEYRYQKFRA